MHIDYTYAPVEAQRALENYSDEATEENCHEVASRFHELQEIVSGIDADGTAMTITVPLLYGGIEVWIIDPRKTPDRQGRQVHTIYLHRSSDELSDLWADDAAQQTKYHYVGYEVQLDGEIDLDTGEFYCQHVNGVALAEEVSL